MSYDSVIVVGMEQELWTIDELVAQVAATLADPGYSGAPNGRVRDVPDIRAIRWYSTIGLVDKPATMRGRTALYGPRHLLQLVAVKRRQAEGIRIADIQAELTGASNDTLQRIADVDAAPPVPKKETARKFWTERPSAATEAEAPAPGVPLNGMHLEGGAVLLLPAAPSPHDISEILTAARPLLDVLAARGLLQ